MDNELELNLDELNQIETNSDNKLKVKNRFQALSDKVKTEAQEREKAQAEAKANADAKLAAERERDFYKEFSSNVSKFPQAAEFQDKILEKRRAGYDTEDAIVAVLAKEGRLNQAETKPEPRPKPDIAGGSAQNLVVTEDKDIADMTKEEKLAKLMELDKSGDVIEALRRR